MEPFPSSELKLTLCISKVYIRRFDVINRGFSGYNSAMAKTVLPKFMPTGEQATVRLMVLIPIPTLRTRFLTSADNLFRGK